MKKAAALSITLVLNLILALTMTTGASGQSPPENERVFLTEFVVRGEFLEFFDGAGGLEIFGYPISIAFEENGRLVQYFQRGRMELHPENPEGQRVMMSALGQWRIDPEPALAKSESPPGSLFFPETGHSVAAAFLRFFESRGGVDFFGYPITEMMADGGRIVQYFERARIEWHPDNPPSLRVQVGSLGEIYLDENNFAIGQGIRDPATDENYRIDFKPPQVTVLDVDALVRHPYAGQNQPQTLYVSVYDQTGSPLAGAEVQAVIRFPAGDRQITLPQTNELGLTWQIFDTNHVPAGETVVIEVIVRYSSLESTAQTSFVVWL